MGDCEASYRPPVRGPQERRAIVSYSPAGTRVAGFRPGWASDPSGTDRVAAPPHLPAVLTSGRFSGFPVGLGSLDGLYAGPGVDDAEVINQRLADFFDQYLH